MKPALLALFLFLFQIGSNAQSVPAQDGLQLLSIIEDWNKGWVEKDYALASKGYSQDARFTNAFGDKCNGQKEIEKLLKEVFSLAFVMSGKSETNDHLFQYLSPEIVVVHTAVTRKGQQVPDGSILPDRKTTHLRVFRRWERSGL